MSVKNILSVNDTMLLRYNTKMRNGKQSSRSNSRKRISGERIL
jgi:hypothetical protein